MTHVLCSVIGRGKNHLNVNLDCYTCTLFLDGLQPSLNEADRPENVPQTHTGTELLSVPVQSSDEPEELEGAVGGAATGTDQDFSSIEWMLSAGVEDPDLMGKIRCDYIIISICLHVVHY